MYCSHNEDKEAAALMEYDSLTENLPKIYRDAAKRLG